MRRAFGVLDYVVMKTLLLLAALSTASPAFAGTLPITGIYGNNSGCLLYAKGGEDAVYTAGQSLIEYYGDENYVLASTLTQEPIVVTPEVIWGLELRCVPKGSALGLIQCEHSDMSGNFTLTLELNAATDILTIGIGPEALHRCPESATM